MIVKVCGKSVYGFVGECVVYVNIEEVEVLYDEEE